MSFFPQEMLDAVAEAEKKPNARDSVSDVINSGISEDQLNESKKCKFLFDLNNPEFEERL